ncbi:acyl carrier protein [Streptomyces caatingaensis]|uniref:Carrier domain-containing protein n=1 Tax=Streptomyces caatingaensis TaxID=1678637 RepID=A0A0K9XBY8_9ACTN|nr:acyl carrier protein [Streptomyces caatingaensis]KNB50934.1 hypothetical protein AC230_19335 [Streptomyces caatingaensis]
MTEEEFASLLRDELAIPVTVDDFDADLDTLTQWSSLYLIRLVVAVEQATGRRLSVDKLLTERSLRGLYALAAG